ncbi:MAG: hypothetical protein WBM07_03150 [Chitinivibrionales bacterium]
MNSWTVESAEKAVLFFEKLSPQQQNEFITCLNHAFPPSLYRFQIECRERALANARKARQALNGAAQKFPPFIKNDTQALIPEDLGKCAIVITAGGDGERLKKSLLARGASEDTLQNFAKATYPLPGFYSDFGALHANLCLVSSINKKYGLRVPVVVTTGPAGSTTARVVPEILKKHGQFGLEHLMVIEQDERLHLCLDGKIAFSIIDNVPRPITHPDETGGPLMKLKKEGVGPDGSVLKWLRRRGCQKIILLQATGLYAPELLFHMASALKRNDCVGAGIFRARFDASDPFGTYVATVKDGLEKVVIVEQEIRNEETFRVKDPSGAFFLPYNTGLYAFSIDMLLQADLPDYATPPKEILPQIPRSPKVGYAATDLFALSKKPVVLAIPRDWFEVIKNADDLQKLSDLGKRFGIDKMCKDLI